MFKDTKAYSGFAVKDVQQAKQFYGETLGLRVSEVDDEPSLLALHIAGDRDILVYLKADHTPAVFTILNFPVDDVESAVDALVEPGCASSSSRASNRTGRASSAAPASPGSGTRPATSCPSSSTAERPEGEPVARC